MDSTLEMMRVLSELDGVSGFENEVRKKMKEYLAPLSDEVIQDRLGGIVGKKAGSTDGPRILIAGHLDEVGWMVTAITDKGFIRFNPLGGWWPHVVLGQRVRIHTVEGASHIGIVGAKPPHILTAEDRKKVVEMKDMFIDVGAASKDDVLAMGIRPGDSIAPVSEFFTMRDGELFVGKAIDNRSGCAAAVEILKDLQGKNHSNVVFAGATVQEEVGCRGAQTLANLVKPDVAFVIDVGVAYDTPGLESNSTTCNLGEGPLVLIYDATMIPHAGLRKLVVETAEELGIHLQVDALNGGGTDGARIHLNEIGCPSIAIGFATRYIHSHTAILSRKDFEQVVQLVSALVQKLDADAFSALLDK